MSFRLIALLVIATLLGGGTLQAQSAERCTTPRAACAFLDRFIAAFNRRDWPAFKATLDPAVTVIFDRPGPPLRQDGHEAVEAVFKRIFPDSPVVGGAPPSQIRPQQLRVQDYGDVVIVSFHLPDSTTVGRRTLVMRRTAGSWKVVHIHGSSSAASRE
jgi:ketosteroid isomerase-like protein